MYRLNVAQIELPPLRERREDVPLLFEHFVLAAARRFGVTAPVVSAAQVSELMTHQWPGNVRELQNVADRFVLGLAGDKLVSDKAARVRPQRLPSSSRTSNSVDRRNAAPARRQCRQGQRRVGHAEQDALSQDEAVQDTDSRRAG